MARRGSRPLLIGLTGNICTGKSTVAGMLAELGAEVIDADLVAHEVMRAGTPIHAKIVETFGPGVLAPNGEIDRSHRLRRSCGAGATGGHRPSRHHRGGRSTHRRRLFRCRGGRGHQTDRVRVVVVEAIKLIESGMADGCDSVWVTTCRPEQQVYRIMGGRGLSRAEAWQRVRAQPPQEEKIARADVVIDTSGTLPQTRAQVRAAWQKLVGRVSGCNYGSVLGRGGTWHGGKKSQCDGPK